MNKQFLKMILVFSLLLLVSYVYVWMRLSIGLLSSLLLAIPFLLSFFVPLHLFSFLGYLGIGIVNFLVISLFVTDAVLLVTGLEFLELHFNAVVYGLTGLCLALGLYRAFYGPSLKPVTLRFRDLPKSLQGLKIVQISDLHVGPTLGKRYVERVVKKTLEENPDIIVLTGDIVDGKITKFKEEAEALGKLVQGGKTYFIMGNHDYYSGPEEWIEYFKSLGITVLLNSHDLIQFNHSYFMMAGVTDPAASLVGHPYPDPKAAIETSLTQTKATPLFKILLAHNPKLAIRAAAAGFDLMLSGHTHGGQFFPWTLIVKKVHSPHYLGESVESNMRVYVSAGTGSWGPPLRLGTTTELTSITLQSE